MAQRAGRISCPRCGANNFDTVTSCWKCGTPLSAGGSAMATPPVSGGAPYPAGRAAAPTAIYGQNEGNPYAAERAQPSAPAYAPVGSYSYTPSGAAGDPGVAKRAAIALALTLPWIGLPIGWVFMMIEDERKQAIGRICAVWSTIALVFHLLLMYVAMQSLSHLLLTALDMMGKMGGHGGGGGLGGNLP
jgi:hypothetical protein